MIRLLLYSFLVLLSFTQCQKEPEDVILSPHTEEKIVGEGYFTEEFKKHRFKFTKSQGIDFSGKIQEENVSLLIKTPTGPITYSSIGNGVFESDEAFQGIYGEKYTVQFSYLGTVHEAETIMPDSVEVTDITFNSFFEEDSLFIPDSSNIDVTVSITKSTPSTAYLGYEILNGTINTASDTIWEKYITPIFRIEALTQGFNSITLPIPATAEIFVKEGKLIKVRTLVYSADVGDYLLRMKNYVESELINSQFYNPPYYYSNGAYGLGYGVLIDSAVYQY